MIYVSRRCGEAKQLHGLSRAKYRGRSKVQIQAYLCAIVQNLKRLLFPLYCWLAADRLRAYTPTCASVIETPDVPNFNRSNASRNRTFSTGPLLNDTVRKRMRISDLPGNVRLSESADRA